MIEIIACIMLIPLAMGSVEDILNKEVSDKYTISFCLLGILKAIIVTERASAVSALALLLATILLKENKYIGGADLIIFAGFIGFFGIGLKSIYLMLTMPSVIALLIYITENYILKKNIITTERGVGLLPAFLLSFIGMILIYF